MMQIKLLMLDSWQHIVPPPKFHSSPNEADEIRRSGHRAKRLLFMGDGQIGMMFMNCHIRI